MLALVTGANRGIGLEFCKQLSEHDGYQVIGVCRSSSADLEKLDVRVESGVDVTDAASLEKLATTLGKTHIDLLVLNAGVLVQDSLQTFQREGLLKQFEVNAMGPLFCFRAFSNLLGKGSRVALVTSRMGSMGDNSSGGYYGYRMSKAALNAAGVSLAVDVRSRGISIAILHPGYVQTDMTGHQGEITTKQSVEGLRKVLSGLSLENTGTFWHTNGQKLPW